MSALVAAGPERITIPRTDGGDSGPYIARKRRDATRKLLLDENRRNFVPVGRRRSKSCRRHLSRRRSVAYYGHAVSIVFPGQRIRFRIRVRGPLLNKIVLSLLRFGGRRARAR